MIEKAILSINPNANFTVASNDINQITWINGTTPIDTSEIQTKVDELQADYDAKQYQRDRQYPSIGDQLDMQYWDAVNGTTTWKDAIAQVKADNPKPQE